MENHVSNLLDDHPRYTPAKPTAEQLRKMQKLLGNLTRTPKEREGDAKPSFVTVGPAGDS